MTSPIHTLEQHLLAAFDPAPQETRRLFHGRGRCWVGLEQVTVDWLQGVLSVALFREPPEGQLAELEAMLRALPNARSGLARRSSFSTATCPTARASGYWASRASSVRWSRMA